MDSCKEDIKIKLYQTDTSKTPRSILELNLKMTNFTLMMMQRTRCIRYAQPFLLEFQKLTQSLFSQTQILSPSRPHRGYCNQYHDRHPPSGYF